MSRLARKLTGTEQRHRRARIRRRVSERWHARWVNHEHTNGLFYVVPKFLKLFCLLCGGPLQYRRPATRDLLYVCPCGQATAVCR